MRYGEVEDAVQREVEGADDRYGPFTSSHEGLGVLIEEVRELEEAIRANDAPRIMDEAVQVSAVARRIAESMTEAATLLRSGCATKEGAR